MNEEIINKLRAASMWQLFSNLSPSHQKEYTKWIAEAKKPATREKRIAKMIQMLTEKQ
jgi:uncharacterized protein YdeI (YjbR/CyaY-like superfamily)